jgi:hypothetical protein
VAGSKKGEPNKSGGKTLDDAAKAPVGNRRERMASFEAARKKEQRRRTIGLLVICVVLALALLAYPLYLFVDDYRASKAPLDQIGASQASAGCSPVSTNAAKGNQQHVKEGTDVTYDQTPPDSGPHYPSPAPFSKRFYTMDDRPAVETLVHNLEHGYLIVWYRDTAPKDQIADLQRISKTFAAETYDPTQKFIAAPWSDADGAGFPAGKNVVLAHWYADPANPGDAATQKGVRQACSSVSGAVVTDFMAKYPYTDAPEPNAQ